MTADRMIRGATAATVLVVAAIAAVVSFVHIEHLAVTHGQAPLAADLLPLSIDGTVAAASMVMLSRGLRRASEGLSEPSARLTA
jgi:acyl-[acyl carrier protein]--UDP-N-acetylglucosamine O-acyltransferase